jgi:glycosidase
MAWDATPGGGFTIGTPWWPLAPGQETANVAAQTADAGSLLSRYRALIRARRASPALRRGDLVLLTGASGPQPVLAYLLVAPGDTVLVAHNLTDGVATASALPAEGSAAEVVFGETGASAHGANGQWTITLPPRGSGVWRLR